MDGQLEVVENGLTTVQRLLESLLNYLKVKLK